MRLEEDNEVYTVDNFMGIAFSSDATSFREQIFFRIKKDSIQIINFDYPDTAFTLTKNADMWLVDGEPSDSTNTAEFINKLSYTTSKEFVGDVDDFGQPVFNMTIIANGEDDLVLTGYEVIGKNLILNSSLNPTAYFEDQTLGRL